MVCLVPNRHPCPVCGLRGTAVGFLLVTYLKVSSTNHLDVEKVERALERVVLSVTERFCVITSKVLPSRLFVVLPAVVVSSVSLL
jgi:hypothetical protein